MSRFGETNFGYAIDNQGTVDVHGVTNQLSAEQVNDLLMYVDTIE